MGFGEVLAFWISDQQSAMKLDTDTDWSRLNKKHSDIHYDALLSFPKIANRLSKLLKMNIKLHLLFFRDKYHSRKKKKTGNEEMPQKKKDFSI